MEIRRHSAIHNCIDSAFGANGLCYRPDSGSLSGVSLKGDTYFYENPLEADIARARWVWHETPCCPPMFLKLMGAMPGYIYATDSDSVYVNLFVGSRASINLKNEKIVIKQTTRYPWEGTVQFTMESVGSSPFNLMLRVPDWCRGETLKVNGQNIATDKRVRGYVQINRAWKKGDSLELNLPMPVQPLRAWAAAAKQRLSACEHLMRSSETGTPFSTVTARVFRF